VWYFPVSFVVVPRHETVLVHAHCQDVLQPIAIEVVPTYQGLGILLGQCSEARYLLGTEVVVAVLVHDLELLLDFAPCPSP